MSEIYYSLRSDDPAFFFLESNFDTAAAALEALSSTWTPGNWYIEKVETTRIASRQVDRYNETHIENVERVKAKFGWT